MPCNIYARWRTCQKLFHFSKVCQSGHISNKVGLVDSTRKFNQSHLYEHANYYLQSETGSDLKEKNYYFCILDSAQTQYVYSTVKVNDKPVNFVIDTGSTVSLG